MKKFIALAALLVLLSACTALEGGQPDQPTISGGGIVAKQGEYLYYLNGTMPAVLQNALASSPVARIYRVSQNGKKEAVSNRKAYDFNIYGEWIYFISPATATALDICRVRINGTGESTVLSMANSDTYFFGEEVIGAEANKKLTVLDPATNTKKSFDAGDILQITAYEKDVYYYINNVAGLRRAALASSEPEVITGRNGRILRVTEAGLYYVRNEENLTYFSFADKSEQTLSNNIYAYIALNSDATLLVGSESESKIGFYALPLDGSTRAKLSNTPVSFFTFYNNQICYFETGTNFVMLADANGENARKVCKADVLANGFTNGGYPDFYFEVLGSRLYYFNTLGQIFMVDLAAQTPEPVYFGVSQ